MSVAELERAELSTQPVNLMGFDSKVELEEWQELMRVCALEFKDQLTLDAKKVMGKSDPTPGV